MRISTRPLLRSLVLAVLALAVVGSAATVIPALDARMHAFYTRTFARPSRSHAVMLVAVDETTRARWGDPPWASALTDELGAEIERGGPRLVIWPQEQDLARPTDSANAPALGIDPIAGPTLLRAGDPSFPAAPLAALGAAPRSEPLPVRYAGQLPTVSAHRVLAGGIPASTFHDRVVVIGRTDAAATHITTPLGSMSAAQIEAQALLGVLDGARWLGVPSWMRLAALALWAVGVAALLRDRMVAELLGLATLLGVAAVMFDAALFAAGVMRLGAAAPIVVVVATTAIQLGTRLGRRLAPMPHAGRTRMLLTTTSVDFHKVSET